MVKPGKLTQSVITLSPTKLMSKLLLEFPNELKDSKFIYVYFFHEYVLKEEKYQKQFATFKPLRITYVKKGEIYALAPDEDVQKCLQDMGVRFEMNGSSKTLKTDSKINVLQILTKEDSLEKKATDWSVSDESEIIKYHKFRVCKPDKIDTKASELEDLFDSEEQFEIHDPDFDS